MKKIFKGFAATLFIGTSFLIGINTFNQVEPKEKKEITNKQLKNNNQYVYNLAPDQIFDPNSSEFDSYWNELDYFKNDSLYIGATGYWLMAIESVHESKNNYEIEFDYSFYANYGSSTDYLTFLNVSNQTRTWEKEFKLDNYWNLGVYGRRNYQVDNIVVPKWSVEAGDNLVFDITFQNANYHQFKYETYNKNNNSIFDVNNYEYLNDFYVNSFNFVNNSITNEGFEFLVDIRLTNGNPFIPYANNLILYSNKMPLVTEFDDYQGSFLKYRVSGLNSDTVYNNFSIGVSGYDDLESLGNFAISTKSSNNNAANAGVIIGSTIGGIILLLLILLIILLLLKRRKKVVEYNYYHNYRTFVDQQGNYIEMNQAEYDALEEDVAAQYTEIDLIENNNYYEYQ